MTSTDQTLTPAIPGAIFVGMVFGAIAGVAVLWGFSVVSTAKQDLPLTLAFEAGSCAFAIGVSIMLLLRHLFGTTIGSVAQAIKNLWDAFGKSGF
jgi:hypothetical protein